MVIISGASLIFIEVKKHASGANWFFIFSGRIPCVFLAPLLRPQNEVDFQAPFRRGFWRVKNSSCYVEVDFGGLVGPPPEFSRGPLGAKMAFPEGRFQPPLSRIRAFL